MKSSAFIPPPTSERGRKFFRNRIVGSGATALPPTIHDIPLARVSLARNRVHETNLPVATPIGEIAQPYFAKGFTEFDEDKYLWVVVQFALVKDGELGAEAAMASLRKGRTDASRATVAYRHRDSDDWVIRYERTSGKLPGPFAI